MTTAQKTKVKLAAEQAQKACRYYVKHYSRKHGLDCTNPLTLHCLCAIASRFLAEILIERGEDAVLVNGGYDGWGHAWVQINQIIIDITPQQFTDYLPQIVIRKKPKSYKIGKIGLPEESKTMFRKWKRSQFPSKRRMQTLHRILKTQPL